MIRVLFVCLGNICRSPMAEAVFRNLVEKEGLADKIEVDSAGTASWHEGKPPHEGTRGILDVNQITYKGMKARQVKQSDWEDFTYIIAMDDQNIKDLENDYKFDIRERVDQHANTVVLAKLTDFVDQPEVDHVPDPYYTGDFDYTFKLVSSGCRNLLSHITKTHNI